jgi:hypothetical protein
MGAVRPSTLLRYDRTELYSDRACLVVFDSSNCPCKAVRCGSMQERYAINLVRNFPSLESFPWKLSGSLLYCMAQSPGQCFKQLL